MRDLHALAAGFLAAACLASGPAALAQEETGLASVYSPDLEGQLTASGQRYDGTRLTAAHRTLPLGTRLRVSDPASGRSVTVLVNDRWGGGPGRVVNLSRRAADELGMGTAGELKVQLTVQQLGDGRLDALPEDSGIVREPLPARIGSTGNDPDTRTARCRNEAAILGLKDAWLDAHVRNCLARQQRR